MAWVATLILAASAAAWGARATLEPPQVPVADDGIELYTITEGTVGRVMSFTAEARWAMIPLGVNAASGTVTSVDVAAGDMVEQGQRLYSVNLSPVIAIQGAVPAFRDLQAGARGADVEQLQAFLAAAGHLEGAASGIFDASTTEAVAAWRAALSLEGDSVVRASEVLFLPVLPARVTPTADLRVGARLSGGETVVDQLTDAPEFTITLGAEQAGLVPLDATVVIRHATGEWDGMIAASTTASTGELVLTLTSLNSSAICGEQCAAVPIGDPAVYAADVIAVPETTGPIVPASALRSGPDGSVTVVTGDGRDVRVVIVAAAEGRAVVSGIAIGSRIHLFADPPDVSPGSTSP